MAMPDMDDLLDALEDGPVTERSIPKPTNADDNIPFQKVTQPQGMEDVLDALDREDASHHTSVPLIALEPPTENEVSPESLNVALEAASERVAVSETVSIEITATPTNTPQTPYNMDEAPPTAVPVSSPILTPPPEELTNVAASEASISTTIESETSLILVKSTLPDDETILELKPVPLDGPADDSGQFDGSASSTEFKTSENLVETSDDDCFVFPSGQVSTEFSKVAVKKDSGSGNERINGVKPKIIESTNEKEAKIDIANVENVSVEALNSKSADVAVVEEKQSELVETISDCRNDVLTHSFLDSEAIASADSVVQTSTLPETSEVTNSIDSAVSNESESVETENPDQVSIHSVGPDASKYESSYESSETIVVETPTILNENIDTTEQSSSTQPSDPISTASEQSESNLQAATISSDISSTEPIEPETTAIHDSILPETSDPTTFSNITVNELSAEANTQLLRELEELESTQNTDEPDATSVPESNTDAEPSTEASTVRMRETPTQSLIRPTSVILSTHDLGVINPEFRLTESELQLGKTKPYWIPDDDCQNCMLCTSRFTVINRRHHCRCCGRVLCSGCCNLKRCLPYNEDSAKKEKICEPCSKTLDRIIEYEQLVALGAFHPRHDESVDAVPTADPTVDDEPGPSSSMATRPAGLRKKSVLKTKKPEGSESESGTLERKRTVQFLDGVRPGYAIDEAGSSGAGPSSSNVNNDNSKLKKNRRGSSRNNAPKRIEEEELTLSSTTHVTLVENELHLNGIQYFAVLRRILDGERVTLAVKRNVWANIQLSEHDLTKNKVWSCSTTGLQSIGIDEIFVAIEATQSDSDAITAAIEALETEAKFEDAENECESEESQPASDLDSSRVSLGELSTLVKATVPAQLLRLVSQVFTNSLRASPDNINHVLGIRHCGFRMYRYYTIDTGVIGSHEIAGVLFCRPLGQEFGNLVTPTSCSFLVGIFVKPQEFPWVRAISNRLLLRLGNSTSCFPYPVVNPIRKEPLYNDITDNSILKMFNSFKDGSYKMPRLLGSSVIIEGGAIARINIPSSSIDELTELFEINKTMIAFSTDLTDHVDSHLVAVQLPDGAFRTEIFTDVNASRDRISASFVVLDGSLRTPNENFSMNIVEDGIVLRFPSERLKDVFQHLSTETPLTIESGSMQVVFGFDMPALPLNPTGNVVSPIDNKYLYSNYQYGLTLKRQLKNQIAFNNLPEWALRLTGAINLEKGRLLVRTQSRYFEMCEQIGNVIGATIESAVPMLVAMRYRQIVIRVKMDSDNVSYETPEWIGLEEDRRVWIASLDDMLIPYLFTLSPLIQTPFNMELYFYILSIRSLGKFTY